LHINNYSNLCKRFLRMVDLKLFDDVSEPSILLLTPEKQCPPTTSSITTDSHVRCFDFNSEFNSLSFPDQIEYYDYTPLEPIGHFDECELSSSLNCLSEELSPSMPINSKEESSEYKKVIQITAARKNSILTLDESMKSNESQHACGMGIRRDCNISPPEFKSIRISIGSFNSVDQICDFTKKDMQPNSHILLGLGRNNEFGLNQTNKKNCCNCKKSRCLKMYCECFANGTYCQGCNCIDCLNLKEHEKEVQEAKKVIGEKNPMAIKRRLPEENESNQLSSGCNCSKSGCLKKYCECFKMGKKCGTSCNCTGCKNCTALRTISYKRCEKFIRKTMIKVSKVEI